MSPLAALPQSPKDEFRKGGGGRITRPYLPAPRTRVARRHRLLYDFVLELLNEMAGIAFPRNLAKFLGVQHDAAKSMIYERGGLCWSIHNEALVVDMQGASALAWLVLALLLAPSEPQTVGAPP